MANVMDEKTRQEVEALKRLAGEGLLYREIAEQMQLPIKRVYWLKYMHANGLKVRRDPKEQENNGNRRFTDAQVLEILHMINTGQSASSIARQRGVTPNAIADIWNGRSYREITVPFLKSRNLYREG